MVLFVRLPCCFFQPDVAGHANYSTFGFEANVVEVIPVLVALAYWGWPHLRRHFGMAEHQALFSWADITSALSFFGRTDFGWLAQFGAGDCEDLHDYDGAAAIAPPPPSQEAGERKSNQQTPTVASHVGMEMHTSPLLVKGLENQGQTCFFNAVLQALNQSFEVHDGLQRIFDGSYTYTVKILRGGKLILLSAPLEFTSKEFCRTFGQRSALRSLRELMQDIQKPDTGKHHWGGISVNPSPLYHSLSYRFDQYQTCYEQQDAGSLLRHLFEAIHVEELACLQKATQKELEKQCGKDYDDYVKSVCFKELARKTTFVDRVFALEIETTRTCCWCKAVTKRQTGSGEGREVSLDLWVGSVQRKKRLVERISSTAAHSRTVPLSGGNKSQPESQDDGDVPPETLVSPPSSSRTAEDEVNAAAQPPGCIQRVTGVVVGACGDVEAGHTSGVAAAASANAIPAAAGMRNDIVVTEDAYNVHASSIAKAGSDVIAKAGSDVIAKAGSDVIAKAGSDVSSSDSSSSGQNNSAMLTSPNEQGEGSPSVTLSTAEQPGGDTPAASNAVQSSGLKEEPSSPDGTCPSSTADTAEDRQGNDEKAEEVSLSDKHSSTGGTAQTASDEQDTGVDMAGNCPATADTDPPAADAHEATDMSSTLSRKSPCDTTTKETGLPHSVHNCPTDGETGSPDSIHNYLTDEQDQNLPLLQTGLPGVPLETDSAAVSASKEGSPATRLHAQVRTANQHKDDGTPTGDVDCETARTVAHADQSPTLTGDKTANP
eukprot:scpid47183/ scgid5785/ Ubiquitin carboxyl-terminal hydrolase 45; Deubiquitinating enzyme 45; Ubiquitin thioesterase 45; Ubiquitin-specific-processing protease 45